MELAPCRSGGRSKFRTGSIWMLLDQLVGHPAIGSRPPGGGGGHGKAEAFQTARRSDASSVVTTTAAVGGRGVVLRLLALTQSGTSRALGARETEKEGGLEEGKDGLGRNAATIRAVVQLWKQIANEGNREKTCINIEKLSRLKQLRPNALGEARLRREGGFLEDRHRAVCAGLGAARGLLGEAGIRLGRLCRSGARSRRGYLVQHKICGSTLGCLYRWQQYFAA